MSTVIRGAKAFIDGKFSETDVLIEGERISRVGKSLKGEEMLDAKGLLLLPGLIDPHVHLREPGQEYKEDFRTGTMAAISGGFTTVIDMPNNNPPTTTFARLEEKRQLASGKAVCNVHFHFGGTDDNFEEARKVNPPSMKIYLGLTTGELYLRKPGSLERHFENSYPGTVIVFHASSAGPEAQSLADTLANVGSVGRLSDRFVRKFHIAHATCAEEVIRAKSFAHGTVEAAPHHLFLSSKDAERLGKRGTVYPALRSESLRQSLWESLCRADCIASDHAPHTPEDKEDGARGFPGLETSLPLMLDAYSRRLLKLEHVIPKMSSEPARIFGLEGVGKIAPGFFADLTLVDPKKEWTVKGEELNTKCKWSPFEGRKLKGIAVSVFCRGELIMRDREFL